MQPLQPLRLLITSIAVLASAAALANTGATQPGKARSGPLDTTEPRQEIIERKQEGRSTPPREERERIGEPSPERQIEPVPEQRDGNPPGSDSGAAAPGGSAPGT
ncbi:hypothetical protein [Stutzerimonas azotifigens]|uniref:Uncharacterized protein n=1 Tax=Stutzerimonas azotifigens TaxID=291995 RepID=A0ABR5YZB3_9GAMM|nr:hypothetical protein [Stutzerimonas azotifigens]MBA1273249.1 hypothetical protein [Stutzerimonas azotifigens]